MSGYSGHIKKCSKLKDALAEAQASLAASQPKKRKSQKALKMAGWVTHLDMDDTGAEGSQTLTDSQAGAADSILAGPSVAPPSPPREPTPPPESPKGRGFRIKARAALLQRTQNLVVQGNQPSLLPPPLDPPSREAHPESTATTGCAIHGDSSAFSTAKNPFGVYKHYKFIDPHYIDPEGFVDGADLVEANLAAVDAQQSEGLNRALLDALLPSTCALRLAEWYWKEGSGKSVRSFQTLVDIIGSDDFQAADIRNTNWRKVYALLGISNEEAAQLQLDGEDLGVWFSDTSWKCRKVFIDVPLDSASASPGTHPYSIKSFYHRPLVDVIREKLSSLTTQEHFHLLPYELRWQPSPNMPETRLHGEMYSSPAFAEAHQTLQESDPEPGCTRPRHIIAVMFASDKSQLAQFGTTAIWPLYFFCGNESKYDRCKPSLKMGEQVAYFEELKDNFKDWVLQKAGDAWPKYRLAPLLTHCKRELFHAQWNTLLDASFREAYQHGIVIKWMDGLERRFYPRIFTYSADYPEKVLIATLRQKGTCPCPRCLIPLDRARDMGKVNDQKNRVKLARSDNPAWRYDVRKAREALYLDRASIASADVHKTLTKQSLVPTENAFAKNLGPFGFDVFSIFATDILHEFELGVWKAIFLHLMRLLQEIKMTNAFDERFRQIPTFGKDTIRKFSNNVSEAKQLAARDYEDILQCSLATFEGLLPKAHNKRVMNLLFSLSYWHGLAKLRMHSDLTLDIMKTWTHTLGEDVRTFEKKTCRKYGTVELDKEYTARQRRKASKKKQGDIAAQNEAREPMPAPAQAGRSQPGPLTITIPPLARPSESPPEERPSKGKRKKASSVSDTSQNKRKKKGKEKGRTEDKSPSPPGTSIGTLATADKIPTKESGKLPKSLSLSTYTYHSLGDAAPCISMFGTTDSYSTQLGELYHRFPKESYHRTSKRDVPKQLSRIQMRRKRLSRLHKLLLPDDDEGALPSIPTGRYFIGKSQHSPVYLGRFMETHRGDPAVKGFVSKLKSHLLPRIKHRLSQAQGEISTEESDDPAASLEASNIVLQGQRIFRHKLLYLNYTTYDVRQDQDIVNPATDRRDIMLIRAQSPDDQEKDGHHFLYGRVLGVFHVNAMLSGQGASSHFWERFDFLWVRWFQPLERERTWLSKRLDVLEFAPIDDPQSFGFVDPSQVLRAAHVIPRFSQGPAKPSKPESVSLCAQNSRDWKQYLVNRFVDRDMLMRFHWGLGVGHLYSHGNDTLAASNHGAAAVDTSLPQPQAGPSRHGDDDNASSAASDDGNAQGLQPSTQQGIGSQLAGHEQSSSTYVEQDDPAVILEAEAELLEDEHQANRDEDLPQFLEDDDDFVEEEPDELHQRAVFG